MFIAQDKLQNNIAEYVIYMYQIEDIVRAYQFDIEKIKKNVIQRQVNNRSFENQIIAWYEKLIAEMKSQRLEKTGHLFRVNEALTELVYLHNTLKDIINDKKYIDLLHSAENNIAEFRKISDLKNAHPVIVCFQALYMKLLLKLQKKEIGAETESAFDSMRIILAYLTKSYHQMKSEK